MYISYYKIIRTKAYTCMYIMHVYITYTGTHTHNCIYNPAPLIWWAFATGAASQPIMQESTQQAHNGAPRRTKTH